MTDERTLLERIGANLRRTPRVTTAHVEQASPGTQAEALPADDAALIARFSAEWQSLAGHVHRASSAEAIAVVAGICQAHQASAALAWTDEALGFSGFEQALAAQGIRLDHGWVPDDPAERAARLQVLAELRVGITGADALLAESGSVVVVAGPGRPRLASLLPVVHITVTRAARVFHSLEHLLRAEPSLGDASSNLVAISGPSRTADIEMTLTRGVHGPGEVHVILIER